MNTRINFQVLNIVNQDSGALGPLGMAIHQFAEPGRYHVGVHREGRTVADTEFQVDADGDTQINIDLTAVARRNPRKGDCECKGSHDDVAVVSPKGYVLFHASGGDGYSATVAAECERAVFDSAKLGKGDLYATSLLEPGKYTVRNAMGTAKAEIEVTLTPEDAKRIKTVEPQYMDVKSKTFEPAAIKLVSSQGLVFRIKDHARVVIERQGDRSGRPENPVIQWRKPVAAKPR
ncbi:MAG: hypothetical protein ACKV2U_22540 [Bryobacteraceae bacterium]